MEQDQSLKEFLSDDERFADIINGFACDGKQIVRESDLQELDTQTGYIKAISFMGGMLFGGKRSRKIKIRHKRF